ncbi:MAG: adenylate/guanylate cyclase domain-containing protein [Elusimicrobiota bacterium]
MKRRQLIGILISVIATLLVLILTVFGVFRTWEHKFYDYKFILRGKIEPSRNIVIVGIDEDSLSRFGRWPWPRSILAVAIRNLKKAGATVVGTDIIFPEHSQDRNHDVAFASALRFSKSVVGATFFEMAPEKVIDVVDGQIQIHEVYERKLVLPVKLFQNTYARLGFTNAYPDDDGVLRGAQMIDEYHDERYYSFNAEISALFTRKNPEELGIPAYILANFRGGGKSYTRYSFSLIYDAAFPKTWVKDKIVLLGSVATGAFDHYPTPFDKMYPGVEFHATLIDNILVKDYIRPLPDTVTLLLVLLFGVGIGYIGIKTKTQHGILSFSAVLIVYFIITMFLFSKYNVHMDFFSPTLSLVISYISLMGYRFRGEEKEKRWIKKTFSYYLSPSVINELTESPEKLKLGGERKNLTVLFSDIRGFTTMSEKLKPEEIVGLLNEYLSSMTEVVFNYYGTLDKFIGDAIMAFWGAPVPQENHAQLAVECALEMTLKLKALQEKWASQGKSIINIGIGINTGDMIVGNMGSNQRMDYTVIGDNVNLASRLETLTRQYNTNIIISESTRQSVKDKIETKLLGDVKVKGKEKPVTIYEAVSKK